MGPIKKILLTILCLGLIQPTKAAEFKKDTLLRDTEIEETLKEYIIPIMTAARLDPERLRLFLIANNSINAAASMDHMIFMHTGLIAKANTPEEIIGVLAHEVGHIAGGHLVHREGHVRKSSLLALASIALGAAAIVAGSPDAGAGIMHGGMQSATGVFLHYGRGQEASADQAALKYLKELGWSAKGLQDFLKLLSKQELMSASRQDSYLLTHPLSSERVQLISRYVKESPDTNKRLPDSFYEKFDRMIAKVKAYMEPPMGVLMKYKANDPSPAAQYARAIAYYRDKKFPQSLAILQDLTTKYPQDPYFLEQLGQVLFDSGNIPQAIIAYNRALSIKPNAHLIHLARIQAEMESGQPVDLERIVHELHKILRFERENSFAWHNLAMVYGKQGKTGNVALALAEKALTMDDERLAYEQAKRADALLSKGPEKRRAQDIIHEIKQGRA